MIYFYLYSNIFRSVIAIISALILVIQIWNTNLSWSKYLNFSMRIRHISFELGVLIHIFLLILLLAQVQGYATTGRVSVYYYTNIRYILFIIMTIIFLAKCYLGRISKMEDISLSMMVLICICFSLPIFEYEMKGIFVWIYFINLFGLLIRAIYLIWKNQKRLKNELSFYSIKEAVDQLDTAVLFTDINGRILLINKKMEELMYILCRCYYRNGNTFFESLTKLSPREDLEILENQDVKLYKPQIMGGIWRFEKEYINDDKSMQITGIEMSKEWAIIEALQRESLLLADRGEEIKRELEEIKVYYTREENLRARARIHDVLGQRISILLQSLRSGRYIEPEELKMIDHLVEDAIIKEYEDVERELRILGASVRNLGVKLEVEGGFPEDKEISKIFMDIIAEAVSNAIRHALADVIRVCLSQNMAFYHLKIINNGYDNENRKEGQGIQTMRKNIAELRGVMYITHKPFTIDISVPRRRV